MKVCRALLTLILFAIPVFSRAQVAVYGEATASNLPNGPAGDYLYGGTLGILVDGPTLFKRAVLSADIQTRYVDKSGERLMGGVLGPRFSFPIKKLKLTPYANLMVGFARYRDSSLVGALNTTDNQWQTGGGVSREISSRFDVVVDASYSQYGTENGKYNPLNYSAGVLFHFNKR